MPARSVAIWRSYSRWIRQNSPAAQKVCVKTNSKEKKKSRLERDLENLRDETKATCSILLRHVPSVALERCYHATKTTPTQSAGHSVIGTGHICRISPDAYCCARTESGTGKIDTATIPYALETMIEYVSTSSSILSRRV